MPVTPLHLGPGLAVKAVAGRHFSLAVFTLSQVLMDVEPVMRILRGDSVLHGASHTYAGAAAIALISTVAGRPMCRWILARWRPDATARFLREWWGDGTISWLAAASGGVIGTFSHVVLDGIMHSDLRPFAPWSEANPFLDAISVGALHALCIATGIAGFALMLALHRLRESRTPSL